MKHQQGFAMPMVLIVLGVSALVIGPTLTLANSALKSRQVFSADIRSDYSATAGVEYGMWRLKKEPGFAAGLPVDVETAPFCITINGLQSCTVILPAAPAGQLSGEDMAPSADNDLYYKITTQVTPNTADAGVQTEFTYTITIQCVDLNGCTGSTPDLARIRDELPERGTPSGDYLRYVALSVGWDQNEWGVAPFEPTDIRNVGGGGAGRKERVEWDFGDAGFSDITFEYNESKTLSFRAEAALTERVYCNWVYVTPGDSNIRDGTEAKITVGSPADTRCPDGLLEVDKTPNTRVINPDVATTTTYTITVENVGTVSANIDSVEDWLPPTQLAGTADAFTYVDGSAAGSIDSGQTIAHDGFESDDGTGGTGTWNGDWVFNGDSSIRSSGGPYLGSFHLRLRGDNNSSPGTGSAQRIVDLSGAADPYVQFWAEVDSSRFDPGDTVDVLVSTGGTSWSTLKSFTDSDPDEIYTLYQFDLAGYGAPATFYLRLEANTNRSNELIYFDGVRFVESGDLSDPFTDRPPSFPVPFYDGFSRTDSNTVAYWTDGDTSSGDCAVNSNYARLRSGCAITQSSVSTASYTDIALSYRWRGSNTEVVDTLKVEWKPSASGTWSTLADHTLDNFSFQNASFALPATADNTTIDLRFTGNSTTGDTGEHARVDDVKVISNVALGNHPICMPDQNAGTDHLDKNWNSSGSNRWELDWDFNNYPVAGDAVWDPTGVCQGYEIVDYNPLALDPGEVLTVTFQATVTLTASGPYYDEVFIELENQINNVSWIYSHRTGEVTVPDYDIKVDTPGSILRANAILRTGDMNLRSLHWEKHR